MVARSFQWMGEPFDREQATNLALDATVRASDSTSQEWQTGVLRPHRAATQASQQKAGRRSPVDQHPAALAATAHLEARAANEDYASTGSPPAPWTLIFLKRRTAWKRPFINDQGTVDRTRATPAPLQPMRR